MMVVKSIVAILGLVGMFYAWVYIYYKLKSTLSSGRAENLSGLVLIVGCLVLIAWMESERK
jgi:hypothetical protein